MQKIVFMLIVSLSFALGTSIQTSTEKAVLLKLLEDNKYTILEEKLSDLQRDYENDASFERKLLYTLSTFENSDPKLEEQIASWLKEKPHSVFAHLAYGVYHAHLGWLSRGNRWGKDTTFQQFAKMRGHFREAKDQFTEVIEKNPKVFIAYAGLISIAIAESTNKKEILQEALKYNPLSSVIRTTYLVGLLPKWGGSYDEIKNFLDETSKLYNQNSALAIQEGFLEYAHGDALFSAGKSYYDKALGYLNKAIEKSTYIKYLSRRGELYRFMKEYEKSVEDYTKTLEISPQDSDLLTGRAKAYYRMKNYDLALADINKAVLYDKMNPNALQTRGFVYYRLGEHDKALLDLRDSLMYGYEKQATHKYIGYIYYYVKKNYRLAAKSLKIASELGNNDPHLWYLITVSQWHDRDCEFVKSAAIYAEKCKKSKKCKKKNLDWAVKSAEYAKKGVCKQ